MNTDTKKKTWKLSFPHPLLLMVVIAIVFYILTFFIQPGVYETDPTTGAYIADSFHYIDKVPINVWDWILSMADAFSDYGIVIAILMGMACYTNMVISVGSINEIVSWASYKLQDKSIDILVPGIVVLMSVMGALAGNDGFAAFVAVGIVLSRRMKLDKISAMGMFYLPYITAQAVGPTSLMILMAQNMVGLPALSGIWIRLILWPIFTAFCAFYVTRYCKKILANPDYSFAKLDDTSTEEAVLENKRLSGKAIIAFILLFAPFVLFAIGSANWGWEIQYLFVLPFIDAVILGLVYGKNTDEICDILMAGGESMGGIVLTFGVGSLVETILLTSNITGTIAYTVSQAVGSSGSLWVAVVLFIFIALVNLITPGGIPKLMWIIPLMHPITNAVGISGQMLCLIYQLGDGLTNFVTPMSTVLLTCLILANVKLNQWLKFALPYCITMLCFSSVVLFILQLLGAY